ncbi:modulator protein, partial [Pantoea graminicola]
MKLLQAVPKRWLPWLIAAAFALAALCLVPGLIKHETVVQ